MAAWMFILEAVTGALLMLHYVPGASGAYGSVQHITHVAPYGFFVRNLHYWCGQIMVVLVVLHAVRVFVTGAFAPPRRFNWIIGMTLLVGTVLVDFTGYLLIWDDRALWAWTVAGNLAATIPVAGPAIRSLLFGPVQVADAVLVRLYAWHILLFPAVMVLLMAWHFWRVRKDGISVPL